MFKGQAEDPKKGLNVFEVDEEYCGPLVDEPLPGHGTLPGMGGAGLPPLGSGSSGGGGTGLGPKSHAVARRRLPHLRVTTNYDPKNPTSGDERFIETVVGYAAPADTAQTKPTDPDPGAPTREYQVGDQILNSQPKANGYIGWVCISPGTFKKRNWQPFGKIDA